MTKMTVQFQTDQPEIDSGFLEHLNQLAKQYGIKIKNNQKQSIIAMIHEDREWLERREDERMKNMGGLRKDLSHLDQIRG